MLDGCAVIDGYSSRAIDYNLEAEQTQNQVLLLNIVRSYLHRPMQFTEIQTILGINGGTAGLGFSFPVGHHPVSAITTGMANGSLTTSTNFTIPVLDTQEFYQGILTPIPPALVDYYLQAAYPKDLIFNLIFEKIGVSIVDGQCEPNPHVANCERTLHNNPDQLENLALFQIFAAYLMNLQMSTEPIKSKSQPRQSTQPKQGAKEARVGSVSIASDSGGKLSQAFRLCFSPRSRSLDDLVGPGALCGANETTSTNEVGGSTKIEPIKFSQLLASEMLGVVDRLGDPFKYGESIRNFAGHKVSITLQMRSTAAIFHYLGQLIHRDQEGPLITLYPPMLTRYRIPCWIEQLDESGCKPIFVVQSMALADAALTSVSYAGAIYSVPASPDVSLSPDVLSFLKELLAMMTSAKSLPASTILSLSPPQ
jgi:hypothetical protein